MARVWKISSGADHPAWRKWMREIGKARERYHRLIGDDPMALSEAATAGIMLSAAGSAGLIGLLEYRTDKKKSDGTWRYGRCDLWVTSPRGRGGWALEIKHRRISSRCRARRLREPFLAAWKDAGALHVHEASARIACTVFHAQGDISAESVCGKTIARLALQSNWACRIDHHSDLGPAYIFFRQRIRGNRVSRASAFVPSLEGPT
jgi:hypothetical protein